MVLIKSCFKVFFSVVIINILFVKFSNADSNKLIMSFCNEYVFVDVILIDHNEMPLYIQCMMLLHNYDVVVEVFSKNSNPFPNSYNNHKFYGLALFHTGKIKESSKYLKKAYLVRNKDVEVAFHLSRAERLLKNYDSSVSILFHSLEQYRFNHAAPSSNQAIGFLEKELFEELIILSLETGNYEKISGYLVSRLSNNYGTNKLFELIVSSLSEQGYETESNDLKEKYCTEDMLLNISHLCKLEDNTTKATKGSVIDS